MGCPVFRKTVYLKSMLSVFPQISTAKIVILVTDNLY